MSALPQSVTKVSASDSRVLSDNRSAYDSIALFALCTPLSAYVCVRACVRACVRVLRWGMGCCDEPIPSLNPKRQTLNPLQVGPGVPAPDDALPHLCAARAKPRTHFMRGSVILCCH